MEQIHIMLDLETWGTKPGCDLRSIGACVFMPHSGYVAMSPVDDDTATLPTFYQAVENPVRADARPQFSDPNDCNADRKYWLHRDPDTVRWWNEQSAEAQAAFADPVDLREGLIQFTSWLINLYPGPWDGKLTDNIRLWSHGPAFDPPILAAAYDAVGLPVPWHYRAPRDTRTAFDMAGIDDHSGFMSMFHIGTHHHALDDAISQAKAVCAAWRVVHPRSNES